MTAGTVSVRMMWPFMRAVPDFARQLEVLAKAGFDQSVIADPDARLPRPLLGQMISLSIEITGDLALGVHAGELIESSDFGVMDNVVRACPDVRRALRCMGRYTRLQDDAVEPRLVEAGDIATIEVRNDIPTLLRATNDFQVTVTLMNLSRWLRGLEPPLEVHFRHDEPTDAAEYARVFRAPVFYGKEHNAIVFSGALLERPVPSANPQAYSLFEQRSDELLRELHHTETTADRVRRLIEERLGREEVGIEDVAGALHMSRATLRRRLDEEGTTYRALLDDLRRRLALKYVAEPRVAIGEIAFLLGFSTQSAFGTAFRRWTGASPLEHRVKLRVAPRPG